MPSALWIKLYTFAKGKISLFEIFYVVFLFCKKNQEMINIFYEGNSMKTKIDEIATQALSFPKH